MEGEGNENLSAMDQLLADIGTEQSEGEAEGREPEAGADAGQEQEKTAGETEDAGEAAGDEEKPVDEDASDDKSGEDEDDEDEKPKAKRASGSERLKRRLAAAEAELQELRRGAPRSGEITQAAIEAEIGPKPKEEDFKGDFLAYERALTAYELDERQAKRELRKAAERASTAQTERMRGLAEDHAERIAEFRTKVADFDATLKAAAGLKASPTVEGLILESDKSAHVLYHLAKNPDRLEKLNRMSEREAAREIGRIEARLSLPKPKVETQAPKPITPPRGGATPHSPEKDLDGWLARTYGPRKSA